MDDPQKKDSPVLGSTTPPTGSPPPTNKPLFVTEEETPPAPVVGNSTPQSLPETPPAPVSTPLVTPNAPAEPSPAVMPTVPNTPEPDSKDAGAVPPPPTQPSSPSDNRGSILPPVVQAPGKKSKRNLIAGIVAVILLVAAIPLGILVINRSTELRERAAVSDEGAGGADCSDRAHTDVIRVITDGDGCKRNIHVREDCSEYEGGQYDCPVSSCEQEDLGEFEQGDQICNRYANYQNQCGNNGVGNCRPKSSGSSDDGGGSGTGGTATACPRIGEAGPLVHAGSEGVNLGNQSYADCATVNNFVNQYGSYAGRAWAVERICGNVTAACDGQNLITQSEGVVAQYLGTYGGGACREWANAHNTEVNNCQAAGTGGTGGTGSGSSGGTGAGGGSAAASCTGIAIYKYPYNPSNLVSAPYNGKFAPGEPVKFCVKASGNGRAEVNINNEGWRVAQDRNSAGEFCLQYDIRNDATTMSVQGRF